MNDATSSPHTGLGEGTRTSVEVEKPYGSLTRRGLRAPSAEPTGPDGGGPRTTPSRTEAPASVRRMLSTVATVIGPATLLTALAFYFGWVSTNATFSYFGLDASVLGLTLQEVVLSSTDALFVPLLAMAVAALAGLAVHTVLIRWADREGPLRARAQRISVVMIVVGTVIFLVGLWAVEEELPFPRPFLFQELSAGVGIALLAYAVYLRRRVRARAGDRSEDPESQRLWTFGMVLVWVIIGLSLFWTVSEYAKAIGRGRAQRIQVGLTDRPSVVVYSERDLHVEGPGVVKEELGGEGSAYRYRYSGLIFLVRSGGKYFLVPASWTRSEGGVVVLPEADTVRVEFVAAGP